MVVLLVFGVVGRGRHPGLARPTCYGTGYGRVLTAKIVVTVGPGRAGVAQSGWLAARRTVSPRHRRRVAARSRVELAVMAVALTLAAALAVTG